jgi:hypothetical protein
LVTNWLPFGNQGEQLKRARVSWACYSAFPLVHPGEVLHFEYSTTKGVPGAAE